MNVGNSWVSAWKTQGKNDMHEGIHKGQWRKKL